MDYFSIIVVGIAFGLLIVLIGSLVRTYKLKRLLRDKKQGFDEYRKENHVLLISGSVLRGMRESLGFSQNHVSRKIGVNQNAISRIEYGGDSLYSNYSKLYNFYVKSKGDQDG